MKAKALTVTLVMTVIFMDAMHESSEVGYFINTEESAKGGEVSSRDLNTHDFDDPSDLRNRVWTIPNNDFLAEKDSLSCCIGWLRSTNTCTAVYDLSEKQKKE